MKERPTPTEFLIILLEITKTIRKSRWEGSSDDGGFETWEWRRSLCKLVDLYFRT